ncbi:MAG: histidinol phosphate phosphatase [Planctomycetia bacterium]|nr:histidinol phosphate phosphatase [Planctomycetia bacterium]
MNPDWKSRYERAVETAEQAGQLALRYFDADVQIEWKADESPVTVADREAESLLRSTLLARFPHDGFLGEEHGDKPGSSGYRWIVDPIDGTRNFVRSIPIWGTLVGLEYQGEMIAGVVVAPALRQTWRALRGDGAYRGERRIRVSDVTTLQQSTVFYTGLSWYAKAGRLDEIVQLLNGAQVSRGFGDFYGFMLTAQGSGELMIDFGVHVWDVAAIKPLIEEAGGQFANWDGQQRIDRPDCIVTNGRVHDEVLKLLRPV